MAITPPADTTSLLVPIHLDAWVVDPSSQQLTAIYKANYTRLPQFESLLDPPFAPSKIDKTVGIHLHWALPDALTHGRTPATGSVETVFPLVPNRWLIARFNAPASGGWQCKLWVVQSDYLGGVVGKTATALVGAAETTVKLAAGSQFPIAVGDKMQIFDPDGTFAEDVEATAVAAKGATSITIRAHDFSKIDGGLVAGSSVRLLASSAFLDPSDPTVMTVARDGKASFDVNHASIGKRHDISTWQAAGGVDSESLFLQAVGPGNVSFAAYMPTVNDVFSFTDTDLPEMGKGVFNYTYMVVGWYSDPAKGDPLRGVSVYDPNVWGAREDWQKQTAEERMATLLAYLKWSVKDQNGKTVAAPAPLATSLYHGTMASVQWPPPKTQAAGPGNIESKNVHVAVGNTAADALAALVQSEARARAAADPTRASQWTKAGDTLAELMQAAMYDLLDQYDKPGSAALVEQQIEQAWYGNAPGGTIWEVVGQTSPSAQQTNEPPQLTPAQSTAIAGALAGLNSAQAAFDQNTRALMSLQTQLYQMWWKVGRAKSYAIYDSAPPTKPRWPVLKTFLLTLYEPLLKETWKQYCAVEQARKALPDPTATDEQDPRSPARWAANNPGWLFPDAAGVPKKLKLAQLGLYLKASAAPPFSHPSDPVLMISGLNRAQRHGEDGRYNEDGTLTCRMPGQNITGLNIQGQPAINKQTVTSGGVNLAPCTSFASIPSVPSLIAEAFFVDPANASVIAKAVAGSDAAKIKTAITSLLAEKPAAGTSWAGTAPTPFSVEAWEQAWSPLFLEWKVSYFPTGTQKFVFSPGDWQFDGSQYSWLGTGFRSDTFTDYSGRTLLTPYAPLTFKAKIEKYLKTHEAVGSEQLKALISTVAGWDVLSQNLSGITDQLITLLSQETFPPPASDNAVQCPPGATLPGAAELIGNQYHSVPIVETTEPKTFFPVRAGFAQFSTLQIVDSFGQVYGGRGDMTFWNNTPQGFQPTLGQGLGLSVASTVPAQKAQDALKSLQSSSAKFQLPPRVVQSARVDLDFLANDGSGKPVSVSDNSNPVCGWLVPNHLDGGISVYDGTGAPLGELLALAPGSNWRPRPGAPGTNPPPTRPADIKNTALSSVVQSIAAQTPAVFRDLLKTIDETLWMVDPLGGRKDQFLSVLIGRPLAVVQVRLKLSLLGDPVFNQFWNRTCTPQTATQASQCTQLKDTGGILDVSFPVRLGSLELRDDGLIGYYSTNYANFYAVHYPQDVGPSDKYLRRIIDPKPAAGGQPYQGDVALKANGDAVTVTMLLDPRGRVHAYTGILPVVSAALPGQLVEEFIRGLQVTFRTGPVVADPNTLRIPQPAEDHGVWSWVQAISSGQAPTWIEQSIVNADDQARIPDAQLQLREGWLKLSGLTEPGA